MASLPSTPAATRSVSPLLCRHFLREFSVPLAGSLTAFLAISMLLAVFDDLPDFSGVDIPASLTALYFLARTPDYLMTVIPVSALLASSLMTIVLGKNQELTAIRSAGLSLLAVATPVWLLSLALCGVMLFLNESVLPKSTRFTEMIRADYLDNPARKTKAKAADQKTTAKREGNSLSYYNPRSRQEWFFADFRSEGACQGVNVTLQDEKGRPTLVLNAATGEYLPQEGCWRFQRTTLTRYDYDQGNLPLAALPVSYPEYPPQDSPQARLFRESPRDIQIQATPLEQTPIRDLLRKTRKRIFLSANELQLSKTLLAHRLATPLSTLIAVLLGFALTLPRGRTSPVRGFVTAVALFVFYTLCAHLFLVLGKSGHLWWPIAGGFPAAAALSGAFYLAWKRQ
ncbi:MAG: LptF/LptG family permease [Oligosphaeraceae bacterium]